MQIHDFEIRLSHANTWPTAAGPERNSRAGVALANYEAKKRAATKHRRPPVGSRKDEVFTNIMATIRFPLMRRQGA